VDDDLWMTVWWPWLLCWAVVAAGLVAATLIGLVHRRARTRPPQLRPTPGANLYLHKDAVSDLFLHNNYVVAALRQEVEEETVGGSEMSLTAEIKGIGAKAGQRADRKVVRKYVEEAEPITLVRLIVEGLEKAGDIIYIDLMDGTVEGGRALERALRRWPGRKPDTLAFARLSELEVFLSVRGQFAEIAKTDTTRTFTASCGSTQVRVTCEGELRRTVPDGRFQARCLGRVRDWDPAERELLIDPIAVFQ
jgi:hypothetical protein